MPAAKKHPSTRARRNKASTAATLVSVESVPYAEWTAAELRAEVDRRNADRTEHLARPTRKASLVRVLEVDDSPTIPVLPDRKMGWHGQTVAWWTDVWSSPMSAEWHPTTDAHNVVAAAMHYDDMWRAETPGERQKADVLFQRRESSLGLTPYDRRRLEWSIESAEDAKDRGRRRRSGAPATAPKTNRSDPRSALHSVS